MTGESFKNFTYIFDVNITRDTFILNVVYYEINYVKFQIIKNFNKQLSKILQKLSLNYIRKGEIYEFRIN